MARDDQDSSGAPLHELLMESEAAGGLLDELAPLAASGLGGDVSCGITIRWGGQPITVSASDDRAAQVDEIQYGVEEGPCLQALAEDELVLVDDLTLEQRWPAFTPGALAKGVRSSFSVPLHADGRSVGALNLYGFTPEAFTAERQSTGLRFAAEASRALQVARRLEQQATRLVQLETAMASRRVIDQAIGVIMAQSRCTPDAAFEVLRRASQGRNQKLRDVAAGIVTSNSGQSASEGSDFRQS